MSSAALTALVCVLGGDSRWLIAADRFGDIAGSRLPYSVSAESSWPPVLAVAQQLFGAMHAMLGDRGLQLAQTIAVGLTFSLLFVDGYRSNNSTRRIVIGLSLAFLGAITSLTIVRLQLFSLPLFAGLVLLLREEERRPSSRIWLVPVLLAVWTNLHGGALVGAAVAGAYLLLHRARQQPLESFSVLLASGAALLATPALLDTPRYYVGVLHNEFARQHLGLWARLDPIGSPFDLVLVLAAGALLLAVARSKPPLWETAVLLGLSAMTIQTARSGVWLLLFAVGAGATATPTTSRQPRRRRALGAVVVGTTILVASIVRGPLATGADQELLDRAVQLSGGSPVAAEGALSEQVALAGGCVWATNPLDAFPRAVQQKFVRWMETGDPRLLPSETTVALVSTESKAARQLAKTFEFRLVLRRGDHEIYLRAAEPSRVCASWKAAPTSGTRPVPTA